MPGCCHAGLWCEIYCQDAMVSGCSAKDDAECWNVRLKCKAYCQLAMVTWFQDGFQNTIPGCGAAEPKTMQDARYIVRAPGRGSLHSGRVSQCLPVT